MNEIYGKENLPNDGTTFVVIPECRTVTFRWDADLQRYEYLGGNTMPGRHNRVGILCPCHGHPVEGATFERGTVRISDEARMEGLL